MSQHSLLRQTRGTSATWRARLRHETGVPLTYHGHEPLSAVIWPGSGRAERVRPTVVWRRPPDEVAVRIEPSDLEKLEVGRHRLRIYLERDDGRIQHVAEAILEVTHDPRREHDSKADPGPLVYGTVEETLAWLPDARIRFDPEREQAAFDRARSQAREWLDGRIVEAWRATGGDPQWMAEQLQRGCLIVDHGVREAVAQRAAALLSLDRVVELAPTRRAAAAPPTLEETERLLVGLTIALDLSEPPDGRADLSLELGVIRVWN